MLSAAIFNSRIKSERVTGKEKALGYFLGPISVSVMASILSSYLNVYYTDVIGIASIGGGLFLSIFPVVCKMIDALTFVGMGKIIDRTRSPQGKARPWILLSAPVLLVSMVLLFAVPEGSDLMRGAWIFVSYNLFYSIGYTAYSTSHTLLVPLSTSNEAQRSGLSLVSNALNMASGFFLAILFPCVLVPMMGVSRERWLGVIGIITAVCCPLLLLEYYFTVERVTLSGQQAQRGQAAGRGGAKTAITSASRPLSLKEQLKCCLKSSQWIVLMVYMVVLQLFNALFSSSVFYYCNWVLGSYNDGITQALFYGVGNAPMGLGIFLCTPICRKFGRKRAMRWGYVLAALGSALCLLSAKNLGLVLIGQAVKSVGLIPSCFMVSTLLADALDDVEAKSGVRCDGFSSSVFNIITTLSGGVALCVFNFCLTRFGYQAPAAGAALPVQNGMVQGFFIFCALAGPVICYLVLAGLMHSGKKRA